MRVSDRVSTIVYMGAWSRFKRPNPPFEHEFSRCSGRKRRPGAAAVVADQQFHELGHSEQGSGEISSQVQQGTFKGRRRGDQVPGLASVPAHKQALADDEGKHPPVTHRRHHARRAPFSQRQAPALAAILGNEQPRGRADEQGLCRPKKPNQSVDPAGPPARSMSGRHRWFDTTHQRPQPFCWDRPRNNPGPETPAAGSVRRRLARTGQNPGSSTGYQRVRRSHRQRRKMSPIHGD